jgi:hypothetical protein
MVPKNQGRREGRQLVDTGTWFCELWRIRPMWPTGTVPLPWLRAMAELMGRRPAHKLRFRHPLVSGGDLKREDHARLIVARHMARELELTHVRRLIEDDINRDRRPGR